jgi:UDP-2,3-diacylglucosamine hydrolase
LKQAKIYFVSDVHLGAPALKNNRERERLFVSWLDQISNDASEIFLLGDIFDFWFEYRKVVPRGFVRTLGKLAELSDRGIRIHFFTGNHDVWAFDYLNEEIGAEIYRKPLEMTRNGHHFLIGHGDGLDPKEKGYLFLKWFFTNRTMQFLFSQLHPNLAFKLAHAWANKSRVDKGLAPEISKGPEFETSLTFAKEYRKHHNIDFFIFGHRHIVMEQNINNQAMFYILGEWINHFTYAVFDGEKIELKQYNNQQV